MGYQGAFLTGNFEALRAAVVKIKKLTVALPKITAAAAPELRAEVERQFVEGASPYRTKWKPLRPATLRKHGPPPLTHTGQMRAGITVHATDESIVFKAPAPAFLHQRGWRKRLPSPKKVRRKGIVVATKIWTGYAPARPIFPDGRVPNEWRRLIRRIARVVMGTQRGI